MGGLFGIWLVCRWFGWFVGSLWVVWLVCGKFVASLASLCAVCGWFGWFVGGLVGLWVIWMVCGWFRVLQLKTSDCYTIKKIANKITPSKSLNYVGHEKSHKNFIGTWIDVQLNI